MPYSKSLTAAYLGMKPESFSRTLAELKKDGIILDNKKIKLANGHELCGYCDKVTGAIV
ncbi:helix-turn-helix domain-containing protein [Isorropodon fossajaponicum symbiont]|uniref:helix-turn-helix domain-containing protein n=1 Tax=Isorropodon fossajaponicum symbiont TaxID=883811 RepID=UPI001914F362|nr:helix-turn-helix domain-containing protein [Isorropodon fossajaponicum symbiont]